MVCQCGRVIPKRDLDWGSAAASCASSLDACRVALPMQLVPQRGQDGPDCLFSLLEPTRQWTRQSSQQVYTVVEVSDLFMGSLVPYKFYGWYVCLWVWPW